MPYIIMKRDDIPAGTLQVLDLEPNTSQRNLIYDPPGQTKYVNPVQNDTVVTKTVGGVISTYGVLRGLAAWFLTNVTDGVGAFATGSITVVPGNAAAGDTVTIGTSAVGGPTRTFTFSTAPTTQLEVLIGGSEAGSAANLAAAIANPNNGLTPYVTVTVAGGVATLLSAQEGSLANGITLAAVGANLAVSGPFMVLGLDSGPLSAADANANATDVLTLLAFGDLTSSSGALTVAGINAVLTTGAILTPQLPQVLDILAGRHYVVPNGTTIAAAGVFGVSPAVGATGGPGFVTGTLRNIYNSGSLNISWAEGELQGFRDSGFIYQGVAGSPNGEAVTMYADDGSFFVPTI